MSMQESGRIVVFFRDAVGGVAMVEAGLYRKRGEKGGAVGGT